MAPILDDTILKTRNLHQRYSLSKNVMELFRAYGDHCRGVEPPDSLGRRLRTSTLLRTCTDTISSLTLAMQKNPTPECVVECGEIIACCTEMLNFANESKQEKILPFMKLPAEIRQIIYQNYFMTLFLVPHGNDHQVILKDPFSCTCANHKSHTKGWARHLEMPLIYTCSRIKDEALKVWFEHNLFNFACSCELRHCLKINKSMSRHLRHVKVHWTGKKSELAFKLLLEVPDLKKLIVVISKSTTDTISGEEALVREYLPQRYPTRISEALGFKQLEKLVEECNLENVAVKHVDKGQAHRRTEQERLGLEGLLWALAHGIRIRS